MTIRIFHISDFHLNKKSLKDLGYVSSDKIEEVSKQISQVAALLSGMRRKILNVNSLTL